MFQWNVNFNERSENDFAQLNGMLAGLHLSSLEIANANGYLCVTRNRANQLISKRFGIDSMQLHCTEATDEHDFVYQIDFHLAELTSDFDFEQEVGNCREAHPDRVVRVMMGMHFHDTAVLLLAHHQRMR